MACGGFFLLDPSGAYWSLNCDATGTLVTTRTTSTPPFFSAITLISPSLINWQLSAGVDGGIVGTVVVPIPAGQSSVALLSSNGFPFTLTVQDNGILLTSSGGVVTSITVPYPMDVTMSHWPLSLNITSSVAGSLPLVVSADYSIWSCALNKFINEDTTNIIVILDE